MDLSIVIPTYNVEEFLRNCLKSVLDQDIESSRYEILVVNDGSTDSSGTIAEEVASKHPNIRVIHQKNQGLSGARNTGIREAIGKYIYFLDSDDYISRNTLGYLLDVLETYKLDLLGVKELVTSRLDLYDPANFKDIKNEEVQVTDGISFIAENNYINNAWWYFIRRDYLLQSHLQFPVGRFVEDANFTAKLLIHANRIAYIPLDFYRYYMRPNSIMRKKSIDHVRKLVNDYKANVIEFDDQLKDLKTKDHPKLNDCIKRIKARQESFVFFLLVKSMRYKLSRPEVSEMIKELKNIGAYPIRNFLGEDYKKISYKLLLPLINNEKLLYLALRLYPLRGM